MLGIAAVIGMVAVLATVAEETEADPFAGGAVLVIGFLLVGAAAAYVASRLARKSREQWDDD